MNSLARSLARLAAGGAVPNATSPPQTHHPPGPGPPPGCGRHVNRPPGRAAEAEPGPRERKRSLAQPSPARARGSRPPALRSPPRGPGLPAGRLGASTAASGGAGFCAPVPGQTRLGWARPGRPERAGRHGQVLGRIPPPHPIPIPAKALQPHPRVPRTSQLTALQPGSRPGKGDGGAAESKAGHKSFGSYL